VRQHFHLTVVLEAKGEVQAHSGQNSRRETMNQTNICRALWGGRFTAVVALVAVGLLFTAAGARAGGCAPSYKAGAAPSIPFVSPQEDAAAKGQVGADWSSKPATIVGLWHVIYTATSSTSGPLPFPVIPPGPPNSFQFVESLKTWHADGTEWENAFLPPAGGNFCYGVWEESGHGSVKLHHIGLMFAADGSLSFIFTDDEENAVANNGKSYSGSFVFRLWPPVFSEVGTGKPLQEVKGTTAATRITVD
jgi:hypothetical protein